MLLNGFEDKIVQKYHNFMVSVSVHLGANKTQAEKDFADVILFEMHLANVSSLNKLKI